MIPRAVDEERINGEDKLMKKSKQQSTNSRMVKPATTMVSVPKTSRTVTLRRKKDRTDLQRSVKARSCTPETWRRIRIKVFHKKKGRRKRRKLSPDLYFASAVQTVFRQSCATDFLPDLIKFNGRVPALPTKRWIIQRQND